MQPTTDQLERLELRVDALFGALEARGILPAPPASVDPLFAGLVRDENGDWTEAA